MDPTMPPTPTITTSASCGNLETLSVINAIYHKIYTWKIANKVVFYRPFVIFKVSIFKGINPRGEICHLYTVMNPLKNVMDS